MKAAVLLLLSLLVLAYAKQTAVKLGERFPTSDEAIPKAEEPQAEVFSSMWAVKISGPFPADLQEKFEFVHNIQGVSDVWLVRHREVHARQVASPAASKFPSMDVTRNLLAHPRVAWAEQQKLVKQHSRITITDPLFPDQWHLVNTGQFGGTAGQDVNIQAIWDQGASGLGVTIAIVDDGFQYTHPDLAAKYSAATSRNFNSGPATDPAPHVTGEKEDFHGTAAAGVALAAPNSACGVGAAFNANGAGIRLISDSASDAQEASGLSYEETVNQIYSNSWGPPDNGYTMGTVGTLVKLVFSNSTTRNGLGSVFTWAGGNGGHVGDNSNYDNYANNINVIAVGAIDYNGVQSYYSEKGANLIVVAPSNSDYEDAGIRTTDILGTAGYSTTDCADDFGGTSSATPLVSGIVALILEAKPTLTRRDVSFILATTARKNDPADSDWTNNAAGYHVNHKYGFGVVDATAAVTKAKTFTSLAAWTSATGTAAPASTSIPDNNPTGVTATVNIATSLTVERVEINVAVNCPYAGNLVVELTSPSGTKSVLAEPHNYFPNIMLGSATNPTSKTSLAGKATFGPPITFTPVSGLVQTTTPADACSAITNCAALSGKIAYINIRNCEFALKTKNAQNCGAIGVIQFDSVNTGNTVYNMGGTDATITIPTTSISYNDANRMSLPGKTAFIAQYVDPENFYNPSWTFSSARHLGEGSQGNWQVKVADLHAGNGPATGVFSSATVTVYGVAGTPTTPLPAAATSTGAGSGSTTTGSATPTPTSGTPAPSTGTPAPSTGTPSPSTGTPAPSSGVPTQAPSTTQTTSNIPGDSSSASLVTVSAFLAVVALFAL